MQGFDSHETRGFFNERVEAKAEDQECGMSHETWPTTAGVEKEKEAEEEGHVVQVSNRMVVSQGKGEEQGETYEEENVVIE